MDRLTPEERADLRKVAVKAIDKKWTSVSAFRPEIILSMLDEFDEYDRRFELQWRRMADATAMWRAATGKHMILPDLGDLLKWLMDEIERLRPKTLEESLEICRKWELTDAEAEELEK